MRIRRPSIAVLVGLTLFGCALQPDPDRARPPLYVEAVEVSETARELVGEADIRAAADEAVAFALEYGFDPTMLDPAKTSFSGEELSRGVATVLTPSSLAVWNARVVAALAGDAAAKEEVRALRMYDLQDSQLSAPTTGDILRSQAITDLTVDVFTGTLLEPEADTTPASATGGENLAPLATVTASSVDEVEMSFAEAAVDGSTLGYPVDASKEWSSDYELEGSWIELTWDTPVLLDRVVLYDRPNLDDQVLEGILTFSDGSSVAVGELANDGSATTVTFAPRPVRSVRFAITAVLDTTWASGLSEFEAWGTSSDSSLVVSFTHEAVFRFVDQNVPFEVVFTREAAYRMARSTLSTGPTWRIAEYVGPYQVSQAQQLTL